MTIIYKYLNLVRWATGLILYAIPIVLACLVHYAWIAAEVVVFFIMAYWHVELYLYRKMEWLNKERERNLALHKLITYPPFDLPNWRESKIYFRPIAWLAMKEHRAGRRFPWQ